jgi:hypothetical protein
MECSTGYRQRGTNIPAATDSAYQYGGIDALYSTAGGSSWFVGGAGNYTGTGIRNFGMGEVALQSLTTGGANIAIGYATLQLGTTANNNVGIGYAAGCYVTTGSGNVFIGANTGLRTDTGSDNICIGNLADVPTDTSNYLNIGNVIQGGIWLLDRLLYLLIQCSLWVLPLNDMWIL